MASGKFDRILGRKERTQLEAFYSGREFAPLFTDLDRPGASAARPPSPISRRVDADGLEPADYPVPQVKPAPMPRRWPKPS